MNAFILETERTTLTPFERQDMQLFHALNTDPFVRKFLWDDEEISPRMAEEIMEINEQHFKEDQYGLWKIILKSGNEVIGYTGLWYFFDEPQPQLLYALLEKFTGQGLATECAHKVTEYAFDTLGFKYLIAATDEPHLASQKVAQRIGMRFTEKRTEHNKPTLFYRIDKGKN